ncbi:MAG: hypothetical protein LBQ88_07440 [Treponema sp.]|jgi:hypothetical protein|nr:hypothetical protein [Treponema sp.]
MSLKKLASITLIFLSLLLVGCGDLDTVFPSSGTYRVDAFVNETSLDDYSVIKQTDAIRPYFINSIENDPDLRGLEVFLQTREGQIASRKIRYILAEEKEETVQDATVKAAIETEDEINAFETETADEASYNKKTGQMGGSASANLEIAAEEIVFELAFLNKDMPSFFLSSELDIGYYTLVFEVLGESTVLYKIEKPVFFLKDAEFAINDIQSFLPGYTTGSHLVPPGTEILLEVEVSASPSLNPYVVWYSAQKRIGESFVSGGNSRIMWTTPSRTGFQTIRAEVFPSGPVSGIKGLSRELSIPISAKNGGIGYFAQEAASLTHWFQLEGDLDDAKAPHDNQRALSRRGNVPPRWLTDMGIYGLAIGPEDVCTLSPVSFKVENGKEGKGVFMLYFKPIKEGALFTAEFKSDNGDNVQLSLSIGNRLLSLALSSPSESRLASFSLDYLEPESFIPAIITFTMREKSITASLGIKDQRINTAELQVQLFRPLNGDALLSFGLQPGLKSVNLQPQTPPVISGDANSGLLTTSGQGQDRSISHDTGETDKQIYSGNPVNELNGVLVSSDSLEGDSVIAILDEFAVSFSEEAATEDGPSEDIQFTSSVKRTQQTANNEAKEADILIPPPD